MCTQLIKQNELLLHALRRQQHDRRVTEQRHSCAKRRVKCNLLPASMARHTTAATPPIFPACPVLMTNNYITQSPMPLHNPFTNISAQRSTKCEAAGNIALSNLALMPPKNTFQEKQSYHPSNSYLPFSQAHLRWQLIRCTSSIPTDIGFVKPCRTGRVSERIGAGQQWRVPSKDGKAPTRNTQLAER